MITTDTSRVALALARIRLMAAKFPYYLLRDSQAGEQREAELKSGPGVEVVLDMPAPTLDIRRGFVYRRVPYVTLKSIANNVEIDEIHARWQPKLDPAGTTFNAMMGSAPKNGRCRERFSPPRPCRPRTP